MPLNPQYVDHVGIVVHDLDASITAYQDLLGLELVHEETLQVPGVRLAYLDAGNVEVQLVAPLSSRGSIYEHLSKHGEGLHHVCFCVEDIPKELARLNETEATVYVGGRGRRVCFLTEHPPGTRIELTEPRREPDILEPTDD